MQKYHGSNVPVKEKMVRKGTNYLCNVLIDKRLIAMKACGEAYDKGCLSPR